MASAIFERIFGVSAASFKTVTDVDSFIEEKTGKPLMPAGGYGKNFVLPQGNVFRMVESGADAKVDSSLKDQGWLRKFL